MATLGQSGKVTMLDIAKATDENGNIGACAELLSQTNEILLDMPWYEGNLPTGHKAMIRTGLPEAIWRQFYQGVPASKSNRQQVTDSIGMLEARAEVDAALASLNGNSAAFRLSEARAFVESMNQKMAYSLFYGNASTNPEQFNGLSPRYSAISGAENGDWVLSAGGGGSDNCSVWLVCWGQETLHGIYPKGSAAGLNHQDLGEIDAFDANMNRYRALADLWMWKCGLHVKDWRYAVRIANIDVSDLLGQTGTQAATAATAIIKMMMRAMARIPHMGMGAPVFYAPRVVKEMLAVAALDKSSAALAIAPAANQFGPITTGYAQKQLEFFGVPVRTCDQLLLTESAIS